MGRSVASWLLRLQSDLTADGRWLVVECGAGDGSLAQQIVSMLPARARSALDYRIVEISPILVEEQQQRLENTGCVSWHDSVARAVADRPAAVISNEFVDAFPPGVFRWEKNGWRELGVDMNGEVQPLSEAVAHAASSLLSRWHDAPDGRRIEVHFTYRDWLRGWLPRKAHTEMLTVDYGGEAAELAEYGRMEGSLRAYDKHERLTGRSVFEHPGSRDITADVNFTDLQLWGQELGLQTVELMEQRDFLLQHVDQACLQEEAARYLLDPLGAGSAFKVLWQSNRTDLRPACRQHG